MTPAAHTHDAGATQQRRGYPLALLTFLGAAISFTTAFEEGAVNWQRLCSAAGFLLLLPQMYFRPVLWHMPAPANAWRPADPKRFNQRILMLSNTALVLFIASLALRWLGV